MPSSLWDRWSFKIRTIRAQARTRVLNAVTVVPMHEFLSAKLNYINSQTNYNELNGTLAKFKFSLLRGALCKFTPKREADFYFSLGFLERIYFKWFLRSRSTIQYSPSSKTSIVKTPCFSFSEPPAWIRKIVEIPLSWGLLWIESSCLDLKDTICIFLARGSVWCNWWKCSLEIATFLKSRFGRRSHHKQ